MPARPLPPLPLPLNPLASFGTAVAMRSDQTHVTVHLVTATVFVALSSCTPLLSHMRSPPSRLALVGLLVLSAAGGAPRQPPPPHSLPRLWGAPVAGAALPALPGLQLRLRGGGKKQKRRAKSTRHVLEELAHTSLRASAVRPRKFAAAEAPPPQALRTGMLGYRFDPAPLLLRDSAGCAGMFGGSAPSYGRAAGEAARQRLRQEQEAGRQWHQVRQPAAAHASKRARC